LPIFIALVAVPAAVAVEVERVDPPSWWSSSESCELALLIEGTELHEATVRVRPERLRIDRVEPGINGRAIFVNVTIAAGAEPGPCTIIVEARGKTAEVGWELLPTPEYRPRPIDSNDVIYLVMPDRFADGDPSNNEAEGPDRLNDRGATHAYHGGDFRGLKDRLPYLANLGVTAIWLTPVYHPAGQWYIPKGPAPAPRMADFHGYSPVDFYRTNPRFGTLEEYRGLVAEAHRLGLKVIQDQILGYVGPRHRWLEHPPGPDWFHGPIERPPSCTFRYEALADPHASAADRRGVTDGWFFGIIPDLDTRNPRVRRYAIQQSLWWAARCDADGIRLDTYPLVERDLWRDWSRSLAAMRPGTWSVGEAWTTDPALLCFFAGGRRGWDGIDPGVTTVFDFPLHKAIQEVFSGKAPARRLAEALAHDGLYPRPESLVTFLDNHDTPRLVGIPGVDSNRARIAAAFLLTSRGIPQLTWGDEIGLSGHIDDRRDFPGGFPGDRRDAFSQAGRTPEEQATFEQWRTLLQLRRTHTALRGGRLTNLASTDTLYAYLREDDQERLVVVLNLGAEAAKLHPCMSASSVTTLYGPGQGAIQPTAMQLDAPAFSATIFQLQ
jgi:glycosidase